MNRTAITAMGLVTFFSGVLVGVLAGKRAPSGLSEPERTARKRSGWETGTPTAGTPSIPRPGAKEAEEEMARLRQRIHALEARLGTVPPTEVEAEKAEELYKHLSSPRIDEDPKAFLRATGLLADLRPTMTPIFAKKFREAKPRFDSVALELALGSGGPDAAALLREILGSPSTPKGERIAAGISLTGEGLLAQLTTSILVDPELANLGMSALALSDPLERLAGVGILGLEGTDQSRSALQSLATQDKDERVRIAALHLLGRVGDRSTLLYLHSYATSSFPSVAWDGEEDEGQAPSVPGALVQTLHRLSQRFPD